jgi:PAS domain S-box-containing protein
MILDMRTLVFSILVTDIVCLLVIILLWQQSRKRFAGIIFWVFDFIFTNATFVLIVLRGSIPDWASIVLANAFAMIGMLLGYIALLKFTGKKGMQIHNYVLVVAVVFVHAYFTYVQPDLTARNVNIAAGILIICFQCAWLMLYRVPIDMRPVTRLVGLVFCGYCLVSIFRIVAFLTGTHVNTDYFQSGTLEKMILVSYQVLFIVLTYSLALMFNRRLQMDIEAEEEKFSRAFHASPYGITITRASDGRIIEVNQGFVNITGYTVPEVRGKNTTDLHLWAREEDRALLVNELLQNSTLLNRELLFRKKSGEIITGLFSAESVTINNEMCVLSSISDITERKRLEESLHKINEQLVFAQQSAGSGIWDWDMKTDKFTWSPELYRLFGLDPTKDEATFDTWNKVLHPDDLASASERIQAAIRDHTKLMSEYRVVLPAGKTRWITALGKTEYEPGGRPVRMAGICIDITERKRAENALRESEERFHRIFLGHDAIMLLIDPKTGAISDANPAAAHFYGYSTEQLHQMTIQEINTMPAEEVARQRTMANEEKRNYFIFPHRLANGAIRTVEVHSSPITIRNETLLFSIIHDITERKRAEEEVRKISANLAQRIADRTRELSDSQLALLNVVDDLNRHSKNLDAANEKLEAANKELEAFSYSVSHDLRAPLRHLGGFVELLNEKLPASTGQEVGHYLKVISDATAQMSRLVDDLLSFSRMGRAEMLKVKIRFDELTREAIETLRTETRGRDIAWKIVPLPEVTGDAAMLRLVMVNLIANAVKFTGAKPKTEIEIGCDQSNEDEYIFSVRDNGAGFDMKYADKLFHLFQRLHRADEFEGTGAGLANVRRIVQRHGGRTWAEGAVGNGAVFYFSLPKGTPTEERRRSRGGQI